MLSGSNKDDSQNETISLFKHERRCLGPLTTMITATEFYCHGFQKGLTGDEIDVALLLSSTQQRSLQRIAGKNT